MYCANCGCSLEGNEDFCPECGEKLTLPEQKEAAKKKKLTPRMVAGVFSRRADGWLRTGMGKIIWRILAGTAILSAAVMAGRFGLFYKNYGWLYKHDFNMDTVSALQQEVKSKKAQEEETEKELDQSRTRYEYLSSYDISANWENVIKRQITELNVENQMIVQQLKAAVMEEMGYTYKPAYHQRQYESLGLNAQNDVIDELSGNFEAGGILGSGVKAGLDAASENAELSNILEGVKKGLAEGTVGYVEDKILGDLGGTVTGILGVANTTKTKIESMGTAPPAALNELSGMQKSYLDEMQSFVDAERITSKDMTDVYNALCDYRNVNQALKALAKEGEQTISPRKQDTEQLIEQYNENLDILQKYIEIAEEK